MARLTNMQFAQRRVLAERAHWKRLAEEGELSEQDLVELNRLFARVVDAREGNT